MRKEAVVADIERLATTLGVEVSEPDGTRRFGGHSMRVSGARWLASRGIGLPVIQTLARWESEVVRRYVGDAVLHSLTAACRKSVADKASGVDFHSVRTATKGTLVTEKASRDPALLAELKEFRDAVNMVAMECEERAKVQHQAMATELFDFRTDLDKLLKGQDAQFNPELVVNSKTGMLHSVQTYQIGGLVGEWRAGCGWRFGLAGAYTFVTSPVDARVLRVCRCAAAMAREYGLTERATASR